LAPRIARPSLPVFFKIEFATFDHWRFFLRVLADLVCDFASDADQGMVASY
jgi:hypothetical protein